LPQKVVHRLAQFIRYSMLMIAAGYEDGNDADTLWRDPMFKLALDRLPSRDDLCSQSTISRLENLPDQRALLRLGRALVEQYYGSFRAVPKRILLDIDSTRSPANPARRCRRRHRNPSALRGKVAQAGAAERLDHSRLRRRDHRRRPTRSG
jgi:Transposase DDE domain group 1